MTTGTSTSPHLVSLHQSASPYVRRSSTRQARQTTPSPSDRYSPLRSQLRSRARPTRHIIIADFTRTLLAPLFNNTYPIPTITTTKTTAAPLSLFFLVCVLSTLARPTDDKLSQRAVTSVTRHSVSRTRTFPHLRRSFHVSSSVIASSAPDSGLAATSGALSVSPR